MPTVLNLKPGNISFRIQIGYSKTFQLYTFVLTVIIRYLLKSRKVKLWYVAEVLPKHSRNELYFILKLKSSAVRGGSSKPQIFARCDLELVTQIFETGNIFLPRTSGVLLSGSSDVE